MQEEQTIETLEMLEKKWRREAQLRYCWFLFWCVALVAGLNLGWNFLQDYRKVHQETLSYVGELRAGDWDEPVDEEKSSLSN